MDFIAHMTQLVFKLAWVNDNFSLSLDLPGYFPS